MIRSQLKCAVLMTTLSSVLLGCAPHAPAPVSGLGKDYDSISRGSYRGSYYEVKTGDTLYFISYVTDKSINDIISYNKLTKPYVIHPGDKLKLWKPKYEAPSYGRKSKTIEQKITTPPTPSPSKAVFPHVAKASSSSKKPKNTSKGGGKTTTRGIDSTKTKEYVDHERKDNVNASLGKTHFSNQKITKWYWPTKGRVVRNYSSGNQGNRGIDIAGQRGQSITAAAAGVVVYSGNALRGYGNLIIIKHNDDYISAYAHNDKLLVKEGQNVRGGQKIATMGSSGASNVRLHFEVRYKGKSVNPKRYLP
ncbi:MAG: peptidoglycan DD-metalloendopeptidase family protein [Vibrio sp.]